MGRNPVISIIGGTIWGNRGAEAMLVTSIGRLTELFPQAHFNIFSYYPQKDRELVRQERIHVLSATPLSLATRHFMGALIGLIYKKMGLKIPEAKFFNIARALHDSDVLLDIGGITFSDGREKFLPFNMLSIWPAMLLGVPVVKMAQALGPFKHRLNRTCAKFLLPRCKHIFARGEQTLIHMQELGLPKELYEPAPDIAFIYKPEYSLSEENEEKVHSLMELINQKKRFGKQVIVFSPSVLVEKESRKQSLDYAQRFLEIIQTLPADRFFYVFMPNATRSGVEKAHNNDLLTIQNIRKQAESGAFDQDTFKNIDWIDYDINTAAIRSIISAADALVTSRYHAMISGLCLGVPTIVMGWGHKYLETMQFFDLQDYSLDFGKDSARLSEMVKKALKESESIRTRIVSKQTIVQQSSERPFLWIRDWLG